MDDSGVAADPVCIHPLQIAHGQDALRHIVNMGIDGQNPVIIQAADDVLIRQNKDLFMGGDVIDDRLHILLLPQGRKIQQHYPGIDIDAFHIQPLLVYLFQ